MPDINFDELFGYTPPAEEKEPEPKEEPAVTEAEETENTETEEQAKADTEAAQTEERSEGEPAKQTPEERHRNAAARRKAERDAALEAERARIRKEYDEREDELIRGLNLTDSRTGKQITTRAEYEDWQKSRAEDERSRLQRKSGLSDDELKRLVDNHPDVLSAKNARHRAEEEIKSAELRTANAQVEEDLKKINALDPTITGFEDLAKLETAEALKSYLTAGHTLYDAFRLSNFDRLRLSAVSSARQQAANKAASKDHLKATSTRGKGAVDVPKDVIEQYRLFSPNASLDEIRAHYQKNHNQE